jgi:transaldolase
MKKIEDLDVKIFADGADLDTIKSLYSNPLIKGITTNPTLARKAGVTNYEEFCKQLLKEVRFIPVSLEVFADDFVEMSRQATKLASLAPNVYVKIPITNSKGESSLGLIKSLSGSGVKINVTAVTTDRQVADAYIALHCDVPSYISVFAGRIADTGVDPIPIMKYAVSIVAGSRTELIWASPRELFNIFQADMIGCNIITVSSDILTKLPLIGKNLTEYSLETVRMFHDDAVKAGYTL